MTLCNKKDIISMIHVVYVDKTEKGENQVTYEKTMGEESESKIELSVLIKCVIEKWQLILSSALICALIGVIFATVTYVPQYTSTIKYVINTEQTANAQLRSENFLVAEYLANTYSYLIKSDDFIDLIKRETGYEENIGQYISSQLLEGSNVMTVEVKTTDKNKSFDIAKAISNCLPEKAQQTVRNGSLEAFEEPRKMEFPISDDGVAKKSLIGALLGAALAIAAVVVVQIMRDTVLTPKSLTDRIDIKHIGSVPHVDVNKKKKRFKKGGKSASEGREPMLVTNRKTGFVFNETYKSMRTKIERYSKKNHAKAILVTSALENEGKTTVVANIAISLAQNGNKVAVLDCDLRKPAVATVFDVKDAVKYQTIDVIEGKASLNSAIVKLEQFGLDIVGGLKPVGNSSEVLSTSGLKETIDELKEKYDYIIVDTPPSQLFTDAAIISEYTDAGLLVVRQNRANIEDIIGVANDISQSNAEIIGFVFNNVEDVSVIPGGGYSKKYNYSYYGYGRND